MPAQLWILLGEAASKCEHVAGVPLRPDTAERLHRLYLAKGLRATTAIEGNTLSEEEVLQHLEGKLNLPPSKEYLAKEIDNILLACNGLVKEVVGGKLKPLSADRITHFNRVVLDGLDLEKGVVPSEIRGYSVGVGRYRGAPAEDCRYLLERLCEWLNGETFSAPSDDLLLVYAIIRAVIAHLYLAWIHPFGDGNGRTARLIEFQLLVAAGVPMPAAHLLSNHYNETRAEYYRQLDRASASGGDIVPFIAYAARGFVDGLRSQLALVREQQLDVAWRNYVHERFQDKTSASDVRRRQLILDLSRSKEPVKYRDLLTVSPRVAVAYAKKTLKTLARDRNELLKMGLLKRVAGGGYAANKELILAFLPPRAK